MHPLRLALVPVVAIVATGAHARLYDRDPPRIELGLEVAFPVFHADDAFADLAPTALFGIAAGVHIAPELRAGLVVRAAISDPEAEHYEILSDLTWSWVHEPRLPDPPTTRVALSLELGWHFTELVGSDFVVADDGFSASLGGELGVVVFEDLSLSLQLALVTGSTSNAALEAWAPELRFGLCLATLL